MVNALLAAAGQGDRLAFAELYDRVHVRVADTVRRVIRDPVVVDSVVRDVFHEIWQTAPLFDPHRGDGTAWIRLVARRRAIARSRSTGYRPGRARRRSAKDEFVWDRIEIGYPARAIADTVMTRVRKMAELRS